MSDHRLEAAIVADDLTGALDMAAPFASRGFATRLLLDHRHKATDPDTEVLTLTSASRDLPPPAAAKNIRIAMDAALARKPRIVICKIDSTLRGNVANAILVALQGSGMRHALIATAVPSQGRTMRGGEVHINGVPLRENPVRFEPSALTATPLSELLRSSHPEISVHSWHRGQTSPLSDASGLHAYVADCESDDDLDRLARLAVDHSDRLLVVGASGLGTALAKQLDVPRTPNIVSTNRSAAKRIATILFVIGSRTPASAEQVARLLEEGAQEVAMPFPFTADDVANSFGSDGIQPSLMVLRPPASLESASHSSDEIAAALGQNAARLARHLKIDALVMSGGDTALATFQALGIKHAVLRHELSPGTAIGVLEIEGVPITFVTKSGSFGDGDALLQIARSLRSA
jgi:uncharacterized protein YgbK (DUF1537 family)